jgi:hypothetical protein
MRVLLFEKSASRKLYRFAAFCYYGEMSMIACAKGMSERKLVRQPGARFCHGRVRLCRTPNRSYYGSKFAQYREGPLAVGKRSVNRRVISSQSDGPDAPTGPFLRNIFKMNILHKNRLLFSPGESDRIQPICLPFTLTRLRLAHRVMPIHQADSPGIHICQMNRAKILKMPKKPKSVQLRACSGSFFAPYDLCVLALNLESKNQGESRLIKVNQGVLKHFYFAENQGC